MKSWQGVSTEAATRNLILAGKPVSSYGGAFAAKLMPNGTVLERCVAGVWETRYGSVGEYIHSLKVTV